jgi:formylglycine-generating enzyme required for sulfatase activity
MTGKDGMILLFVPAGEFTMGSDTGYDNEKPVHTVDLDAFWIDKTEVTNAMFAKFIDETGHLTDAEREGKSWVDQDNDTNQVDGANWLHPLGPSNGISDIMDHPVVHVSLNDAQAYCSWANRRLPTEAEWEKAASWDAKKQTKYVYPWGNDEPNNNLLNYNGAVGDTTEVGKYPDGASPYGALDMAGNVFEWINDWYVEGYYASLGKNARNPQGPTNGGGAGILRGGAWNLDLILVRSSYRRVDASIATTNSYGFRCSRSP